MERGGWAERRVVGERVWLLGVVVCACFGQLVLCGECRWGVGSGQGVEEGGGGGLGVFVSGVRDESASELW